MIDPSVDGWLNKMRFHYNVPVELEFSRIHAAAAWTA
jgi:hypothetical protein